MIKMYCSVVIPGIKVGTLDYATKDDVMHAGQIVKVSFRNKEKLALVLDTSSSTHLPESKVKSIINVIESTGFSAAFIEFLCNAAKYYYQPLSGFVKLAIPSDDLFDRYRRLIPQIYNATPLHATLSPMQKNAAEFIEAKLTRDDYGVVLLEGVTGSGKTEVYLNVISRYLSGAGCNKQVLILLPEIALTKQLLDKIKQRCSIEPAIWHSDITKSEKKRIYQGILDGSVKLLIGARSALFLPYNDIGLIVVDEEHDSSYKQEDQIIYNARDMAVYRAYHQKFLVVLASATPSIETLQNVSDKKYDHIELVSRYGVESLPEFHVIDMKKECLPLNRWISNSLHSKMNVVLHSGNQVLLYLNRRGYAPLMLCASCGYKPTCDNCSSWLVEHRFDNKLKCHHCNYTKLNRGICPACKQQGCMRSCGPGVERIAEEAGLLFPGAKIAVITRDTMSSPSQMEQVITSILSGEVSIIIGTQMVAKGHHFPKLTLVGIIDADIGFGGSDLRATEKTYQLLEQVSGRSGRELPGVVAVQTYNTDSQLLGYIVNHDREKFIQEEIRLRKFFNFPPFARLANILVTAKKELVTQSFAQKLSNAAPRIKGVDIYGPLPSYFVRLKDKYRYQIVIKCTKNFDLHKYLDLWLGAIEVPSYINLRVDIDPYNFT
jgi:primosomal protein N' (replication factor Y)